MGWAVDTVMMCAEPMSSVIARLNAAEEVLGGMSILESMFPVGDCCSKRD